MIRGKKEAERLQNIAQGLVEDISTLIECRAAEELLFAYDLYEAVLLELRDSWEK